MEYTVAAVDEALGLLILVADHPGLGVTELAKRSGNTKARAFRLLCTLEQRGFVQRSGDAATYRLGHKSLLIGLAAREQVSLVHLAEKYMSRLGERFNENVQVRVRDGLHSLCVARWETTHELRIRSDIGQPRPLHAGASGKVLLAYAPEEIRQAVLSAEMERFTPSTIHQRSKLSQDLARIKAQGYSVSNAEVVPEIVAVAAPIWDSAGQVSATLSIAVPASRVPAEGMDMVAQEVVRSAGELSRELGYAHAAPTRVAANETAAKKRPAKKPVLG
ncbi:IclR family transcriptional regulator [Schlegelella sp. S2-27]|uniref:IclR family transcriptional regulator n=1 Tax=Caldimonas mangrovi TaxID=2944811 RepID=A0ABT0YPC2_9BURK|nr:IclR family transcriptional regulator [Caldimonas mangrovi]MCM5680179.1 IclR family transcriptional regulator [Caldimonas mangrovi]